jgi:DNA-binding transcriptional ArsR family regulator
VRTNPEPLDIPYKEYIFPGMTQAAIVLDALGEANRRALLQLLHEHGESTVTALVDRSGLRQPSVSKHLKVLSEADLVTFRPEGRRRHYRLEPSGLQVAHEWFASFEDVWQQRFDALDALVSSDALDQRADGSSATDTDRNQP